MIALAQPTNEHRIAVTTALTTCNGCGMHRLCREYEGLWLCIDGPSKCYRRRRTVKADKDRKESEG